MSRPLILLGESMCAVAHRARELDLRAFEVSPPHDIHARLKPTVLALVREARAVLRATIQTCDELEVEIGAASAPPSGLSFELALDAKMESAPNAVAELAFMAQLELRQREEVLERLEAESGALGLLSECDSALRRIRKALAAVEAAVASAERAAPSLGFASELDTSLRVRREYARLRERLALHDEPPRAALHARFRVIGTRLAMFVGSDVYPDLRIADRLLLRALQARILDWLRLGAAADETEGRRIWQDLAASLEMFSLVNRRQELVAHDRAVVEEAIQRVHAGGEDDVIWSLLSSLHGLDAELDVLLRERPRPASCLATLERLGSVPSASTTSPSAAQGFG